MYICHSVKIWHIIKIVLKVTGATFWGWKVLNPPLSYRFPYDNERVDFGMDLTVNNEVFKDITSYTEKVKKEMNASGSALIIMKDNKIVHEWYSGTHHFEKGAPKIDYSSRFNVYSVRVTYVGLAIAIAAYEGSLDLEDKLSNYLT